MATKIKDSLVGKTAKEKADLKAVAIKAVLQLGKHKQDSIEIEIVETNVIDGGIEVFARAWKDGAQLGFGADGTIDIERFRIFNPPVLVDDPLGDIVNTWTDQIRGDVRTRTLREDPEEAILQSLTHTISIVGMEGTNIVAGSRGNTTSTFYPIAGTGSTNNDNSFFEDRYNVWSTARNGTDCRVLYQTSLGTDGSIGNGNGAGYYTIQRYVAGIDTSAIPDGDNIVSATFSVYGSSKAVTGTNNETMTLVGYTGSISAVAVGDYDLLGAVSYGTTGATFSTTGYNDITINATGLATISKTGVTQFGLKGYHDFNNVTPTTSDEATLSGYDADDTGTTRDPKLVVVHGVVANSGFFNFM